ncbi:DinB family protein [Bacillus salacetis]|uniref:DinB family protein n=1 Tax=Bacillus salacetis TaxID=2315464 RepID=UPI003B9ECEC1
MFQTVNGFLMSWERETASTQKALNNLTDESLKQEVSEGHWSLGRTAWHITTAIKIISSQTNLKFDGPAEDYPVPGSASYIAETYKRTNAAFIAAVKEQWSDDDMAVEIDVFGQKMNIGTLLLFLMKHEIHHRGQMTVLMRQAGLNVPGFYGPSKEEWALMGMEAPKM